ncbi:serine hydrolase [Frankia sp. CNm7]|uniref:Serine hydrolase n=1 Tax=Frankia nepalensis TaxID=1836974 RepID=A0A937URH9_9ACTN|nr:serine hydrolase [Frankia nepalensis]MBL7514357.1 serine hydrolase [Frankia nepalensis]MBL7523354.1 serine hydrolase [Frankia nepalensis]MBL7631382.1 serine hydrolase [Frankia nepalensis]
MAAVLGVAACGGGSQPADAARDTPSALPSAGPAAAASQQPGAEWETVDPAKVGLDPAALAEIAKTAEQGKSNCLLVVRDGRIAGEWYFRGTDANTAQQVFSVTKSVTSTLTGIAQDEGDLKISESASTWIPSWKGTPSEVVTVRDLLSNSSGRRWSVDIDYNQLVRAADQTAFAVGLDQASPPGQVWAYNNSAIQTLQQVLEGATGQDPAAFAEDRLFGPLGMAHTSMGHDSAGNAQTYAGVTSTCRDLARFGLLALSGGTWHGKQIVSADWLRAATATSSTELNAAYGYLWWLNHEGVIGNPRAATDLSQVDDQTAVRGQLVAAAPDDMFWAIGLGNQVVQVDPGSGTVVVRLGTPEVTPTPPTFGPAEASRVVTEAVTGPVG